MKELPEHPDVSIIMATYNRGFLIREALNSIALQNYKNWECLVVDDGSEDETQQIVKDYSISDNRFRYVKRGRNYKKGLPGCRNLGLDLAKGRYVIFVDDDDIMHPENLEVCLKLLSESEYYYCRFDKKPFIDKLSQSDVTEVSQFDTKELGMEEIGGMVTGRIPFASCTVFWDKRCFTDVRFNEELLYAEEWECYSRILSKGLRGISINQVLYYNRKHPNSNTGEFWNKDQKRVSSYKKAARLIIDNLGSKNLLNKELKNFFLSLGFMLNSRLIIKNILEATHSGRLEKMKYLLGFEIYPILKPLFNLKGKILKI